MGRYRLVAVGAFAAALLAGGAASAAESAALAEAMSFDGLQKINVKGVELAYARPGATLAGYDTIQLDPIKVAFYKDWTPTAAAGSAWAVTPSQIEDARKEVVKLAGEALTKELTKSGYPLANAPGPHVLRVSVNIVNLVITAPLAESATMSRTWTRNAGQATLYAELIDSQTGSVIARVVDTQVAQVPGGSNYYMDNAASGEYIVDHWAKLLINGLNRAREQLAQATPAAH